MSSTLPTVHQALSIDRYSELSLCFNMVHTVSARHRHSSLGYSSAIGYSALVEVRVDAVVMFLVIFGLFVGSILREDLIFFVDISLSNGSVVNLIFVRDISRNSFEEGILI